jgi:Ras-related protein Rab-1A
MSDYDFMFKILVIGDSGVGKSSLLRRFVDSDYSEEYSSTIGIDFKIKTITVDRMVVKLQIWDTAGQERFRSLGTSYFRGSHGVFIVTDITDPETFHHVSSIWIPMIKQNTIEEVPVIILVNKCDLKSQARVDDTQLDRLLYPHFKTSAKTELNIFEPFEAIIRKMIDSRRLAYEPQVKLGRSDPVQYIVHIENSSSQNETRGCKC